MQKGEVGIGTETRRKGKVVTILTNVANPSQLLRDIHDSLGTVGNQSQISPNSLELQGDVTTLMKKFFSRHRQPYLNIGELSVSNEAADPRQLVGCQNGNCRWIYCMGGCTDRGRIGCANDWYADDTATTTTNSVSATSTQSTLIQLDEQLHELGMLAEKAAHRPIHNKPASHTKDSTRTKPLNQVTTKQALPKSTTRKPTTINPTTAKSTTTNSVATPQKQKQKHKKKTHPKVPLAGQVIARKGPQSRHMLADWEDCSSDLESDSSDEVPTFESKHTQTWDKCQFKTHAHQRGWTKQFREIIRDVLGDRFEEFDWRTTTEEWMFGVPIEDSILIGLDHTLRSMAEGDKRVFFSKPNVANWEHEIAQLRAMGFGHSVSQLREMLVAAHGDIQQVVDKLFHLHTPASNSPATATTVTTKPKSSSTKNLGAASAHAPHQQAAIQRLVAMGFTDIELVTDCLRDCGWNVDKACDFLLGAP
eukprot:c6423_g1_i1.p1 GENE.c6423_g1_i1~~c6423_g1_i1.p1  ORF type:complete len:477 (+),score=95.08 c6423_g1_i1:32-1462(+)